MTKAKNESTAVSALSGSTDIAAREGRVGQGSENVSASDMAIPRLKLAQAISDEVQAGNPLQIDGLLPGNFFNTVSKEIYTSLYAINLHFSKNFVVWKKRKLGGGMFNTFETDGEARAALAEAGEPEANFDIKESPTHLLLILNETGVPQGIALFDMPGSKVRVSKQWNSQINAQEKEGNPRFGCVWQLSSIDDSNNEGPYKNVKIDFLTCAPDSIYQAAETAYDTFFAPKVDEAA